MVNRLATTLSYDLELERARLSLVIWGRKLTRLRRIEADAGAQVGTTTGVPRVPPCD
jgi:hypothetical protein